MARDKRTTGAVVGINLGTKAVKVAEVRPTKTGPKVVAFGVAPVSRDLVDETGFILDPEGLGALLKDLLTRARIQTRQAICSISGQSGLVIRVIEVPKMNASELDKSMKWEIERQIPFAANTEAITDYGVLAPQPGATDDANMEVMLAAVPKDVVDAFVKALQVAKLQPAAIDSETLAAGRAVLLSEPDLKTKTVVVLNIGASQTDMGVFSHGELRLPRVVPVAGNQLTQAIVDALPGRLQGDTPAERFESAERMKLEHGKVLLDRVPSDTAPTSSFNAGLGDGMIDFGFQQGAGASVDLSSFGDSGPADTGFGVANPFAEDLGLPSTPPVSDTGMVDFGSTSDASSEEPSGQADAGSSLTPAAADDDDAVILFDAMAPTLGEFMAEIRRSIDFYRGRANGAAIDRIVLCGGGARLPYLDRLIEQELSIPTTISDTFEKNHSVSGVDAQYISEMSPMMAVAFGLGARDMTD